MFRGKRTRGRDTGEPEHDTAVESVGDLLGWVRNVPKMVFRSECCRNGIGGLPKAAYQVTFCRSPMFQTVSALGIRIGGV